MNCINFFRLNLSVIITVFALLFSQVGHSQSGLSFDQEFSPATIGPGNQTTLIFTITNNTSTTPAMNLAFNNTLFGLTIGGAGTSTTCTNGQINAPQGGTSISFSNARLGASKSCTVSIPVTGNAIGTHTNTSGNLTSSNLGSPGSSSADLTIATNRPGFSKAFSPTVISPGNVSRLTFTIDNSLNGTALTSFNFSDDLPGSLVVASPADLSTTCNLGTGSINAVPGSGIVSASSTSSFPSVPANESCTISLNVTASDPGSLINVTSDLTITNQGGGTLLSSGFSSAPITVLNEVLSKSFTNDPVVPGGSVNLRFTIKNLNDDQNAGRDNAGDYTSIAFSDDLDAALSGLVYNGQSINVCGGTLTSSNGGSTLNFSGGSVSAGQSCTINVPLSVPGSAAIGSHLNTTSPVVYHVAGEPITGNSASDFLTVRTDPVFTKTFLDNPAVSGGTTTLRFEITNTNTSETLENMAFTDEFDAILKTATSVPSTVCNGTHDLTFDPFQDFGPSNTPARLFLSSSGPGGIAPGATCTFDVILNVVNDAFTGDYPNTTSILSGTVDGQAVSAAGATDILSIIGGPSISKEFIDNPVCPGENTTLIFTIEHDSLALDPATDISFTDDLGAVLSGLNATGLPLNACGGVISGTNVISFSGGSLAPGAECSISVEVSTPTGVAGTFTNSTSELSATVGNASVTNKGAVDELTISPLTLTKEFLNGAVQPGGTATLQFTLENKSGGSDATSISFTDNVDDMLNGATLVTPLDNGTCDGTLVAFSSDRSLQYSGGTLNNGESCTFTVDVNIPANADPDVYSNTTDGFGASFGGSQIALPNAVADLTVAAPPSISINKSFNDSIPPKPGDNVVLSFSIGFDGSDDATNINFSDDLGATLTGLVATGLPSSVCGGTLSGTSVLSFTGGSLTPGNSCNFNVTLSIPGSASPGNYTNSTSTISTTVNGQNITGDAAVDILTITQPVIREPVAEADYIKTFDADGLLIPTECPNSTTLDGSGSESFHPGGLTSFSWSENGMVIATGVSPVVNLDAGTHLITLTVTDGNGSDSDDVFISISDKVSPTITCPPDVTICSGETPVLGNPTVSDSCDPSPTVTNDAPATFTDPVTIVKWKVTDASGNADSCYQTVTIADNAPPTALCKNITVELDADGDASITAADIDNGSNDACSSVTLSASQTTFNCSDLGSNTVILTVTDEDNNSSTCEALVTVKDVTPPSIVINPSVALIQIWPPNHQYESFDVDDIVASVDDNCSNLTVADVTIDRATSDEPDNEAGDGDGNTTDDIVISGDCKTVSVRQERQGSGNGRVYTVVLVLTDDSGNTVEQTFNITVPINKNGSAAVDDGPAQTVNCGGASARPDTKIADYKFTVNPNPAKEELFINLESFEQGLVDISIFNSNGQKLLDQKVTNQNNGFTNINISDLNDGTYFLVARQKDKIINATFVKIQ